MKITRQKGKLKSNWNHRREKKRKNSTICLLLKYEGSFACSSALVLFCKFVFQEQQSITNNLSVENQFRLST